MARPDAGVAAGGLDDRLAGLQGAGLFGRLDHAQGQSVLHRTQRVEGLDLDEQVDSGRRELVDPDHRRCADGLQNVAISSAHCPASRRLRPSLPTLTQRARPINANAGAGSMFSLFQNGRRAPMRGRSNFSCEGTTKNEASSPSRRDDRGGGFRPARPPPLRIRPRPRRRLRLKPRRRPLILLRLQ